MTEGQIEYGSESSGNKTRWPIRLESAEMNDWAGQETERGGENFFPSKIDNYHPTMCPYYDPNSFSNDFSSQISILYHFFFF